MISEKIKTQGELHKGYIVGMKFIDDIDLCVDVYFDGNAHSVMDNSFIEIYDYFDNRYSNENNCIFVEGILVDVYVFNEGIYLDLDSVKKENL